VGKGEERGKPGAVLSAEEEERSMEGIIIDREEGLGGTVLRVRECTEGSKGRRTPHQEEREYGAYQHLQLETADRGKSNVLLRRTETLWRIQTVFLGELGRRGKGGDWGSGVKKVQNKKQGCKYRYSCLTGGGSGPASGEWLRH